MTRKPTTDRDLVRAAEQLDRAADVLVQHGHMKGAFWAGYDPLSSGPVPPWTPGTPCCALGAIAVAGDHDDPDDYFPLAAERLAQHIGAAADRVYFLSTWNDLTCTTATDVITAMRGTATQLRTEAVGVPA